MAHDPADEWLRADAERQGLKPSEYERRYGIMFDGGPAENRAKYHESPGGIMDQGDLMRAAARERNHTPERNRKRRRGWSPDGAIVQPSDSSGLALARPMP
jgi:hypothetical protein